MFHRTFWSRLELWLHVHLYHFAESCFISLNWHIVFASGVHSAFFFFPDLSSFALRFEFENYRFEFKICLRASVDFFRLQSHFSFFGFYSFLLWFFFRSTKFSVLCLLFMTKFMNKSNEYYKIFRMTFIQANDWFIIQSVFDYVFFYYSSSVIKWFCIIDHALCTWFNRYDVIMCQYCNQWSIRFHCKFQYMNGWRIEFLRLCSWKRDKGKKKPTTFEYSTGILRVANELWMSIWRIYNEMFADHCELRLR